MSNNQVDYGIRINVNGNQASASAVDQVTASVDGLTSAARRASDAVQAQQGQQAASTATMQAAEAASRSTAQAIDQVAQSTAQLGSTTQRTSQAVQAAQGSQASSNAALQAAQTGVTEAARSQAAQLDNVTSRHSAVQEATRNTNRTVQQLGVSQAQLNNAMRQVPAQFTDIVTALQGGQAPLTVLLQQGGQLRDSFGSIGAAARGLGSYVLGLITPFTVAAAAAAALAVAYISGSNEASAYSRAIALSGNAAGATASELAEVARQIGQVSGSQRDAAGALTALVGTGRVSIDNMKEFASAAVEADRVLGRSIGDTAADFAELGKAPLSALDKINDKYHFITAATYAQVKALNDQGRAADAANVAQKAYADGIEKQKQKVLDSLTDWERGWLRIKKAANGVVDAVLNIGRGPTDFEKINSLLNERATIEANLASAEKLHDAASAEQWQKLLDRNKREIDSVRAKGDAQRAAARAQEQAAQQDEARKKWLEEGDKYLSRAAQLERDLTKARNEGKAAGVSQAEIDKRLTAIRKQYSDLNNVAMAGLDAQRNLEKQATANSLADLESRHKQDLVSDAAYIAAKRDMQLQDLAEEEAVIRKKADLAAGKADLSERKKYLGQLRELEEQRKGIIQGAQNALNEYAHAATKAIADQTKAWANVTATERTALADEANLFGQSAEARKIAAEQLKVDAELRQLVINWQKQGHTFTAQEIADLQRSASARKDEIAAIMGQRQALEGAEQLRQENLKFAAESIGDVEARAARLLEIDANVWRERIKLAGDGTEAQRKLQEQFDQWYANRQLAPVLDRWKNVISNLDNDFRDGFRDMLEHGHDAWKSFSASLGNTLKASLADALYQTFIKKYVVQIVTNLAGEISGAGVQAALSGSPAAGGASVGGLIGAAQTASSLYKLVTGGFDGLSDMVAGGVQSAMSTFGFTPSAAQGMATGSGQALTSGAYYAGQAAGYLGGAAAGKMLGSAISGGYQVGDHGSAVVNVSTIVGSVIGGPIGGAIGGAIGGLINRAFGMSDKQVTASGMRGTVSDAGVAGMNYQTWHQDGGWFRSDKNGTDTTAFSSDVVKQFTEGFAAIKSASQGFATDLGVSADAIKSYSKDFNVTLTNDTAANQQAITDLFTSIGNEMAQKLVPNLDQFSKAGEAASTTLERLAGDFKATNSVAQLLGASTQAMFGATGIESAAARERLIDLAGGVDALGQQAAFFAQNFMTEAERLAPVSASLDAALASLGLKTIPTTRAEFKALVMDLINSGAVATEVGAKQYASLMALEEAFAQVHPEIDSAVGSVTGARAALTEAYQAEADAIKQTSDRMASFAAGLRGLRDSALLGDLSPLTPMQKYAEARAQFDRTAAAARAGDETAQANFEAAYTAFLNASKTVNASGAQYQRDFAYAQAATEEAIGWAKKQVDVGQASLQALQQQVSGLIDVKTAVNGVGTTVSEAIKNLVAAMGASGASLANAGQTNALESLYHSLLGRSSDAAGLAFWQQALSNGMSISDVAAEFTRSDEYKQVHGSHANGLGYVPFDGYIAELHQGEAVLTANEAIDYRAMGTLSMAPLVAEIKSLREERSALIEELRGLRQDQEEQAGAQAEVVAEAADQSANKIVQAVGALKAGQGRETRVIPV